MHRICSALAFVGLVMGQTAWLTAEEAGSPVVYDAPESSIVPAYRYVGEAAVGKVAFYSEYGAQNDEPRQYRGDRDSWLDNLEVITEYSTFFPITLRSADEPEKFELAVELARRAYRKKQLLSFSAYGTEGVDKLSRVLDRLETLPEGKHVIRNTFACMLGDEPYLAGRSPEQVEQLIGCFDRKIQSRYPHIQSWINFAVSTRDVRTWGTGEDGLKRLPQGLDIVSIDWYAYLGNGTHNNWGHRDFRVVERQILDTVLPTFLDEQTQRLQQAIAAAYQPGEEPMMILLGTSSYVWDITHPTPVSVQDAYFEYVKKSPWAGLMWWIFEDFKDCIGGRHHEIIRSHQRHGQRIRAEGLY
ncbi:MAG: hypothetical protein JXB62_05605 [Pirellulales bacterium]|nr:hypothetical protein [Pirellulales bacterium]